MGGHALSMPHAFGQRMPSPGMSSDTTPPPLRQQLSAESTGPLRIPNAGGVRLVPSSSTRVLAFSRADNLTAASVRSSSATCSLRRRVRCLSAPRAVASLAAYPGGESVQSSWIRQSGRLRREFCIDPTVSSECASSEARFWRRAALGARGSGSVSPALATTRVLRAVAGSRCASRAGLRALGLTRSFAGRRSCR